MKADQTLVGVGLAGTACLLAVVAIPVVAAGGALSGARVLLAAAIIVAGLVIAARSTSRDRGDSAEE